ncbi:MAG TPA: hypothetical protein PLQ36_04085 [Candidatus Gracilibacteria bacterium]|nr:hypothetical protein [Candidatus Gracilibacteria bacterium]
MNKKPSFLDEMLNSNYQEYMEIQKNDQISAEIKDELLRNKLNIMRSVSKKIGEVPPEISYLLHIYQTEMQNLIN